MFNDDLGFNPFDNKLSTTKFVSRREKFLNSFGIKHIFCYNGNPRKKISSMNHTDTLDTAIEANAHSGSDVYFYVNGGRKLYAINNFTCCFCDIDAGRDSDGKYFKPSVVMQKKKTFLERINNFAVPPTWVVDTRNGYQCYWIFDDQSVKMIGKNKTYWNGLQKKLVNYFSGDPRAIKANQIYRVPYTWWRKNWEKKAPYFTSILQGSTGQKVNVVELQSALTGQPATVTIDPSKCSDDWYKGYAKAYKNADQNGVPVSIDVAKSILNDLQNQNIKISNTSVDVWKQWGACGQKNSLPSVDLYDDSDEEDGNLPKDNLNIQSKAYGVPTDCGLYGLNLTSEQTRLLKTVVEYLNQASTALYFSNNRFLSSAAKDLAAKLSDQFCVG